MTCKGLPYFAACKNWPEGQIDALEWLCENGVEIDRAAFLERVSAPALRWLEKTLGYRDGRSMGDDWHVRYARSPDGAAQWLVHSAIEYVFAAPATIDAIQVAVLEEKHTAMSSTKDQLLILVHPGSLYGSAASNVGKAAARDARENIWQTLMDHEGALLVIDGMFSDEIPPADDAGIEAALAAARAKGCLAIRAWGCDAGERPPDTWLARRRTLDAAEPLVADGQCAVIDRLVSGMNPCAFATLDVGVTGAWASHGDSGCVNSVMDAILAHGGRARVLDCALYEPDAEEPDIDDEVDDMAQAGP